MALWFERKFNFDAKLEHFAAILKKLESAADRMEAIARGLTRDVLVRRDDEKWSIQEQFGHLLDLDELHIGRLDDFEADAQVLRPADLENKKTWEADHNSREVAGLIGDFRCERRRFTERLQGYNRSFLEIAALHPRLRQQMRVIDLAVFVAEHDDHHLTRAEELKQKFLPGQQATLPRASGQR